MILKLEEQVAEIKLCPFCSTLPSIVEMRWKDVQMNGGNFIIFHPPHPICILSGLNIPRRFMTKAKAIEHWNVRTEQGLISPTKEPR